MRERLIQYIDLLFAGMKDAEDIKQEIMQNTLDRFDDLVAQGKTPEAAYSLAISGIGDLSEILNDCQEPSAQTQAAPTQAPQESDVSGTTAKLLHSIAIALYILCPIPLFILQNELGLCGLLGIVAIATALIIFSRRHSAQAVAPVTAKQRILTGINTAVWIIAIVLYGKISDLTDAWYITWVIFPAAACVCGIIKCCFYIRENFVRSVISGVIQLLVLALLVTVLLGGIYSIDFQSWSGTTVTGTASTPVTLDHSEIDNIHIEWVAGKITVQPTDGLQAIKISETGATNEDDAYIVKQQGNTLNIQYCKPKISIGIFNQSIGSKDLLIQVPRQWICGELKIDSVSAYISVEDITANSIDLVNVSGSCVFTGCSATEFEAETVSGSVTYNGEIQVLDFNTVSADCVAVLSSEPNSVEFDSVSGDMELTMPADIGYRLDWDSASGDFRCDYSGNSHIYGDYRCEITADTVSGDVTIKQAA